MYNYVQGSNGPLDKPHMRRNAAHKQGDASSICGNTLSTNQTHSRGSTGPPEHLNHLKRGPHPWVCHGGPPSSLQTKFEAVRPPFPVGRPKVGLPRPHLPRGDPSFDAKGGARRHRLNSQPKAPCTPSINMRGGAPFQHTTKLEFTSTKCNSKPPLWFRVVLA